MDEYVSYMKTEKDKILNARVVPVSASSAPSSSSSQPSPSVSSTAIAATSETAVVPFIPAPEITVEDVTGFVQQVFLIFLALVAYIQKVSNDRNH